MRTIALFIVCVVTLQAAAAPERVAWGDTPQAFAGKRMLVRLTTGARLEGLWIGVTAATFTVQVEKTSDKNLVRKGVQTLPRLSILALKSRDRRVRGRVIGILVGYCGTVAIAGAATRSPEALQSGWGPAAVAAAVAGYFLGRASDRATREVILLP